MTDIIELLPDSVANQIAAGEVIQRPAAVIKELVENAVDAGATVIRVSVKDAGKTSIQVIDNGRGMSPTDARMAFERHATSKIKAIDDLFKLRTMGFRGEALPSICAISEVEVRTRLHDEDMGTQLVIRGSRKEKQGEYLCDPGTNIEVRQLFFNVPARRKFLKSDSVELSNITREFERLALVNEHLHMSLDTGHKKIDLKPGSLLQRIGDIWKNGIEKHLIPVMVDTGMVKIEGYVSRPEYAKRRNPLQYLMANGRYMVHNYFHKAVVNCFENLIASDTQPCYFLRFTVNPETIDVNISPTKSEIKFENQSEIWRLLQNTVQTALGKYSAVPSIDFNTDAIELEPLRRGEKAETPTIDDIPGYNPFTDSDGDDIDFTSVWTKASGSWSERDSSETVGRESEDPWDSLRDRFERGSGTVIEVAPAKSEAKPLIEDAEIPQSAICLQYDAKYIVTTSRAGLLLIDQHRAHVKILFEQYRATLSGHSLTAQAVLFPETLVLTPSQEAVLGEIGEDLKQVGFTLEREGEDRWTITTVPPGLHADPREIVAGMLDSAEEGSYMEGREKDVKERLFDRLALSMARTSAYRGGRVLSNAEMEHLVGALFRLPDPLYTPSGQKIFQTLTAADVAQLFKQA